MKPMRGSLIRVSKVCATITLIRSANFRARASLAMMTLLELLARLLTHFKRFDYIVDLDILIGTKIDTALESFSNLSGIIFEAA